MDVTCTSCTSPDFDELVLSLYALDNVTELDSLFEADFVQDLLDRVVGDSAKQCPHRPEYDPNATISSFLRSPGQTLGFMGMSESVQKTPYFNIANSIIAGCIFVFGVLCRWLVNRRNKIWIQSLSHEGRFFLQRQHEKQRKMEEMLDASTTSLYRSPYISRRIQMGVPIAILVNIGLYMGGHLGTLLVINIDASLAGEPFTIYDFLEFTFLDSTKKTYNNGGAEMAILIWIFTGIWPYIKLLLSLLLWMLPPERLSVARRGRILLWIDALAKLSAVDIFVMLLGLAIILVFVGGPDKALASDGVLYSMKAIVVPQAGFYCFIVAQRMSRASVISMAARDYERKQLMETPPDDEEDDSSSIERSCQELNRSISHRLEEDDGEMSSIVETSEGGEGIVPKNTGIKKSIQWRPQVINWTTLFLQEDRRRNHRLTRTKMIVRWREMKPNLLLGKNFDGERWASSLVLVSRFSLFLSLEPYLLLPSLWMPPLWQGLQLNQGRRTKRPSLSMESSLLSAAFL